MAFSSREGQVPRHSQAAGGAFIGTGFRPFLPCEGLRPFGFALPLGAGRGRRFMRQISNLHLDTSKTLFLSAGYL